MGCNEVAGKDPKRRKRGAFISLPKALLFSREYAALSNGAKVLLIDIAAQYKGYNNGALTAAWKPMRDRGWKSKRGLYRARDELLETGFLVITHYQRSTSRRPIYYAITWEGIDETKHTRDQRPSVVPTPMARAQRAPCARLSPTREWKPRKSRT